ncbi:hypothetical protein M422DRAFT_243196 [Sphaerobolus stellatus SS14]|nr:hypothetical protein M422DRAFT_243196 [Sphaerobolus stellatus SS14]
MALRPKSLMDLPVEVQDMIHQWLDDPRDLAALGHTSRYHYSHTILCHLQFRDIQCDLPRNLSLYDEDEESWTSPSMPCKSPPYSKTRSDIPEGNASSNSTTKSTDGSPESPAATLPKLAYDPDLGRIPPSSTRQINLVTVCDAVSASLSRSPDGKTGLVSKTFVFEEDAKNEQYRKLIPLEETYVQPLGKLESVSEIFVHLLPFMRSLENLRWKHWDCLLFSCLLPLLNKIPIVSFEASCGNHVSLPKTLTLHLPTTITSVAIMLAFTESLNGTNVLIPFVTKHCPRLERLEICLYQMFYQELIRLLEGKWDMLSCLTISEVNTFPFSVFQEVRPALELFLELHPKIRSMYFDMTWATGQMPIPRASFTQITSLALSGGSSTRIAASIPSSIDISRIEYLIINYEPELHAILERLPNLCSLVCRCPNNSFQSLLSILPSSLVSFSVVIQFPPNLGRLAVIHRSTLSDPNFNCFPERE